MRIIVIATFVTLFLFLVFSYSFSQSYSEEEYTDVILLKSGGVYLGVKVVRVVPRKKVVVENIEGIKYVEPGIDYQIG